MLWRIKAWNGVCSKKSSPPQTLPLRTNLKRNLITLSLGLAWLAAVAYGGRVLLRYETEPGRVGNGARIWPADCRLGRTPDKPTLVIFAHPRCPCTRATIEELNQIMARAHGRVRAYVVFYQPSGAGPEWKNTGLQRKAANIPGIEVVSDVDGSEASHFGAETSGHTMLYDRNGQLLFSGGITASRGHVGDNAGQRAIVSLVNEQVTRRTSTLVFGCSLRNHTPIERGP